MVLRIPSALLLAALYTLLQAEWGSGVTLRSDLERDRDALIALKRQVDPGGYGKSIITTAWRDDGNPCEPTFWTYVSCRLMDDGEGGVTRRVSALNLTGLDIKAPLPIELGWLTAATSVDLGNNRFYGSIPQEWGAPGVFPRLRSLILRNNDLSGRLPNSWNRKGAWRVLNRLDISANSFVGPLPWTWMGSQIPFPYLKHLNMSSNRLGYQASGKRFEGSEGGWCTRRPARKGNEGGQRDESPPPDGWCPAVEQLTRKETRMRRLQTLDLSYNGLQGVLPRWWPRMFFTVQNLRLQGNDLYSTAPGLPQGLPQNWTRTPGAFNSLREIMLSPGNSFICQLPDADTQGRGFVRMQADADYSVIDSAGIAFNATYAKKCPGPEGGYLPPQKASNFAELLTLALPSNEVVLRWRPPLGARQLEGGTVFGYKVTLGQMGVGPVPDWDGKLFVIYDGAELPEELVQDSGGAFTLNTGVFVNGLTQPYGTYTSYLTALYIDGGQSEPLQATVTAEAPTFPEIGGFSATLNGLAGTPLAFIWAAQKAIPPASYNPTYSWKVDRWVYRSGIYLSVASGSSSKISQQGTTGPVAISPSPQDSYRVTVTGSATSFAPRTTQWWAIISGTTSVGWSVIGTDLGPKLSPPQVSIQSPSPSLATDPYYFNLLFKPNADVAGSTVQYDYKIWQYGSGPPTSSGSFVASGTTAASQLQVSMSSFLAAWGYYKVSVSASGVSSTLGGGSSGFYPSDAVDTYVGLRLGPPTGVTGALDGTSTTLTVNWVDPVPPSSSPISAPSSYSYSYSITQYSSALSGGKSLLASSSTPTSSRSVKAAIVTSAYQTDPGYFEVVLVTSSAAEGYIPSARTTFKVFA